MPCHTRARPFRSAIFVALLMVMMLIAFGTARPAAVRADDGCDPAEPIACLPLPEEGDSPGIEAPQGAAVPSAGAAAPGRPLIACPLLLAAEAEPSVAAPLPPAPRGCLYREIVAAVNRANVLYARALRALDSSGLRDAWGGEALADLHGQIATLRSTGRYATPQLLSIAPRELRSEFGRALVRTIEHWIYQERARLSGVVLLEQDQWVENVYTLEQRGGSWIVMRDVITLVDPFVAPPPPPRRVVSASISTDDDGYPVGGTVQATVTNDGGVTLWGGGGWACGLMRLEWFGPDGWQRAPLPDPRMACLAIARGLRPGESQTETLPAGNQPGIYRIAFSYSADTGDNDTAYAAPHVVR